MMAALPGLADEETWRHPMLAAAVCNSGDHGLRDELLELGARLPAVLDALDALPQTYQHGDASPQNLLVPKDNEDEFVVIDWGFDCPQAVGFDLGQLLIGLAHAGELSPDALPAVHRVIVPAFMEGLAADGMIVPEEQVLYGYLGSLMCRAAFTALPLELFGKNDSATEGLFDERVRLDARGRRPGQDDQLGVSTKTRRSRPLRTTYVSYAGQTRVTSGQTRSRSGPSAKTARTWTSRPPSAAPPWPRRRQAGSPTTPGDVPAPSWRR